MSRPSGVTANLSQLAAAARRRVTERAARWDLTAMAARARETLLRDPRRGLLAALADGQRDRSPRIIAEVKRGSPAAGIFDPTADAACLASRYATGGAAAISVITEPDHFCGDPRDLVQVRAAVPLPILQKDFIVGPYQVYEAVVLGADAILLIAAILTDAELKDLLRLARQLGLAALVEVNQADETAAAVAAGARLIGINNRNLHTFAVDLAATEQLRPLIPPGITVVGASGVRNPAAAARLAAAGVDALLVGESLVRSGDPAGMVRILRQAASRAASLWVKICGVCDQAGAQAAVAAGASAVGFVFADSPRRIEPGAAAAIAAGLPAGTARVGVFVDADIRQITAIARQVGLTHVQLHGGRADEQLAELSGRFLKTIRAVAVRDEDSLARAWYSPADLIILDTYSPTLAGGTGQTFDWPLAAELAVARPTILAGGLNPGNVGAAVAAAAPYGVDVASGVEAAPGRKDPRHVAAFVRGARIAAAGGPPPDSLNKEATRP